MKAEKRIQRTGGGTPYVYLPKEWVDDIFSEDQVVVQRLPLALLLTPPSSPVLATSYHIDSDSPHQIKEAVLSAYTQGHREVRVTFPALGSQVTSEVSRFATRLIGVVPEVRKDGVRLREYAEHEKVDLALLVQGLFSKCREMASACRDLLRALNDAGSRPDEALAASERIEDDADFLSFGLFRMLSSRSRYGESPGEQLINLLFYAIVNYAAERYCDALFGMANAVREIVEAGEKGRGLWAAAIGPLALIPHDSLGFLERAEDVVLRRDGRKADALRAEVRNRRHRSWEPAVAKAIQALASSSRSASIVYPATQIGSRLLESGTYVESFCSRTSQFHFAGIPSNGNQE